MPSRTIFALALLPLLAACANQPRSQTSGAGKVQSAASKPPLSAARKPVRQPTRRAPPAAQTLVLPGLEGVIGATSADLVRQFGTARLDVWEGDARKLQFSGTACVLDIYLYPAARDLEPQATYLDARRSDGRDVDRAACVAALRRR